MANFIPPANGASLGSLLCQTDDFSLKNSAKSANFNSKISDLEVKWSKQAEKKSFGRQTCKLFELVYCLGR